MEREKEEKETRMQGMVGERPPHERECILTNAFTRARCASGAAIAYDARSLGPFVFGTALSCTFY